MFKTITRWLGEDQQSNRGDRDTARTRLGVERLESRELPSTFTVSGDVNGDHLADQITVSSDPLRGVVVRTSLGAADGTTSRTVQTVLGASNALLQHGV